LLSHYFDQYLRYLPSSRFRGCCCGRQDGGASGRAPQAMMHHPQPHVQQHQQPEFADAEQPLFTRPRNVSVDHHNELQETRE
jgi:hypothetical protein